MLLTIAVLVTGHKGHKGKKGSYPSGPQQVIILPAGPSVTYPWVGHGHHKGHFKGNFKGKIPYIPRPAFPSLLPPAPPAPVYQVYTYAPAVPQYAPAVPQYAPEAPQYAPVAPQYAPAAPEYALREPAVPQYDPLPAPVYAAENAGYAGQAQNFPSFSDFAPAEVLIEPINSFGPEPRPLAEEPVFSWGTQSNPFEQEEQYAEDNQEQVALAPQQELLPLEPVVFGAPPQEDYAPA